jgi:hypothetical protein
MGFLYLGGKCGETNKIQRELWPLLLRAGCSGARRKQFKLRARQLKICSWQPIPTLLNRPSFTS